MDKLSIKETADRMGKSEQYVRIGLQTGRLPFGSAVKLSTKWSYHIVPNLFYEYMGIKEVKTNEN